MYASIPGFCGMSASLFANLSHECGNLIGYLSKAVAEIARVLYRVARTHALPTDSASTHRGACLFWRPYASAKAKRSRRAVSLMASPTSIEIPERCNP